MPQLDSAIRCRRVLVVDDFPDAADVTCTLLRLMGHEARAAYTGTGALAAAASFQPEILILDLGLPDMSGFEVASALRRSPAGQRLYIAAVSGWGQPEDRRRALAAGCDLHVVKPTDRSKLQRICDIVDGIRV
jgi:two-component system, sensor histidine kinase